MRLNRARSLAELHRLLIDEVCALCPARRVLLVLDTPRGFEAAGSQLPKGETEAELLQAITPWLAEARRTLRASLRHGPEGAAAVDQRSCLIAPLTAHRTLGYLYLDIEGEFGRFEREHRDLVARFASRAAQAMADIGKQDRLEATLAEQSAQLEQRNAELAVINSVQQGITGSLDFQGIVDLVGDKLREIFATGDISIRWYDATNDRILYLYEFEHGVRLHAEPRPPSESRMWQRLLRTRKPVVRGTRAELETMGLGTMPGTDTSASALGVPIQSGERMLGIIVLNDHVREHAYGDSDVRLLSTIAASMGIALENARLFDETRALLERQTATAEILKVISGSPTDVQPVLDAIAARARLLCAADFSAVRMPESGGLRALARHWSDSAIAEGSKTLDFMPIRRTSVAGRAFIEGRTIHVEEIEALIDTEYPDARDNFGRLEHHSVLVVPLLHDGAAIGTISLFRTVRRAFSATEIALVQTFADQAVIAIQNARLFNETKEALERQTATGEILASMSGSMTETQPVFDAIARNLLRLFGTEFAIVALVRDGNIELAGIQGTPGFEKLAESYPLPLDQSTHVGQTILSGSVSQLVPIVGNPSAPPRTERFGRDFGYNSQIAAPMVRDGKVIGVICTAHRDAVPFDDKQIALIKSFADQAVIAVEKVRLFNETEEALEQRTATADILKVISESPTDVQPVFDAIAERARVLCNAIVSGVTRFDGEWVHLVAYHGVSREADEAMRSAFPMQLSRRTITARAIRERAPVQIADVLADPDYGAKDAARLAGYRSNMAVPMLREGQVIGSIAVCRAETGPFPEKQVKLLKTFADQAVIAIENVRLFNETQGGARAADGDRRGAAGDQRVADRRAAGVRRDRAAGAHALRRGPVGDCACRDGDMPVRRWTRLDGDSRRQPVIPLDGGS